MDQPDFGELFDPDLDPDFFDKMQWAKVRSQSVRTSPSLRRGSGVCLSRKNGR